MRKNKLLLMILGFFLFVLSITGCSLFNHEKTPEEKNPSTSIKDEKIVDIEILGKTQYLVGSTLESDFIVNLIFESGGRYKTNNYTIKGLQTLNMSVPGKYTINFTISTENENFTRNIIIEVLTEEEYGKAILNLDSGTTKFVLGKNINFDDWIIKASYLNGKETKTLATSEYTIANLNEISNTKLGKQKVLIRYVENDSVSLLEIEIEIIEDKVKALKFVSGKTTFVLGQGIDITDWKFVFVFESKKELEVNPDDIKVVLPDDVYTIGTKTAAVYYKMHTTDEIEIKVNFEIRKGKIQKLLVEGKTNFDLNEIINISDWKYKLLYEYDIEEEIIDDSKISFDKKLSEINTSKIGNHPIIITYKDGNIELKQEVIIRISPEIEKFEFEDANFEIILNDELDISNWKISLLYVDKTKELINNKYFKINPLNFDSAILGEQKIKLLCFLDEEFKYLLHEEEILVKVVKEKCLVKISYGEINDEIVVDKGDLLSLTSYYNEFEKLNLALDYWEVENNGVNSNEKEILNLDVSSYKVLENVTLTAKFKTKYAITLDFENNDESITETIYVVEGTKIDVKKCLKVIEGYLIEWIQINGEEITNIDLSNDEPYEIIINDNIEILFFYEKEKPTITSFILEGQFEFIIDEKPFSTNDWNLKITYSDDSIEEVENPEFDTSDVNPEVNGTYNVKVKYEDYEFSKTVQIYKKIFKNTYKYYSIKSSRNMTVNFDTVSTSFPATMKEANITNFKDLSAGQYMTNLKNTQYTIEYNVIPSFVFLKTYNEVKEASKEYEAIGGNKYWAIPLAALTNTEYLDIKVAASTSDVTNNNFYLKNTCLGEGIKAIPLTEGEYISKSIPVDKIKGAGVTNFIATVEYDLKNYNTIVLQKSIVTPNIFGLTISGNIETIYNTFTMSDGNTELPIYFGYVRYTDYKEILVDSSNSYLFRDYDSLIYTYHIPLTNSFSHLYRPTNNNNSQAYTFKLKTYKKTFYFDYVEIIDNYVQLEEVAAKEGYTEISSGAALYLKNSKQELFSSGSNSIPYNSANFEKTIFHYKIN